MRIIHLAGNAAIESVLRSSADIMKESQRMPFYRRELLLSTWQEHRAIVDALIARDAGAAGIAIETHIANAAQRGHLLPDTPHVTARAAAVARAARSCRSTSRRIPIRERTLDERTRRDAAVRALRVSSAAVRAGSGGSISSAHRSALSRATASGSTVASRPHRTSPAPR